MQIQIEQYQSEARVTQDKWDTMSKRQKSAYVKQYPRSKFAKQFAAEKAAARKPKGTRIVKDPTKVSGNKQKSTAKPVRAGKRKLEDVFDGDNLGEIYDFLVEKNANWFRMDLPSISFSDALDVGMGDGFSTKNDRYMAMLRGGVGVYFDGQFAHVVKFTRAEKALVLERSRPVKKTPTKNTVAGRKSIRQQRLGR